MKDSRPLPSTLRMVAWEVTRSCNLACAHCRASSVCGPYEGELDTAACLRLLDEIAAFSSPVIILTGGEPLLRPDIWEIAAYGDRKGLRMVMATNGTMVTEDIAKKMLAAGIRRVSVSIDGPDAESHDRFRRVTGAFAGALAGIEAMQRAGVAFEYHIYPDAPHAFFNDTRRSYRADAARDAWARCLMFFATHVGPVRT